MQQTIIQPDLFSAANTGDTHNDPAPAPPPDPPANPDTSREAYEHYAQSMRDAGDLPLPYPLWRSDVEDGYL